MDVSKASDAAGSYAVEEGGAGREGTMLLPNEIAQPAHTHPLLAYKKQW